ncbi:CRISPR-associated endonuclease Cas3'' [Haloarcula sp. CBA1130]|uniref:CRISPR-associated endonuclease Cas3'' n=1 Tax=unclassified Haloarcula TaxID=2624677 RepID=UPI001243C41D|nr:MULTISPECIES: CRISPR-associated endonuclease Cas3'' [unclassified Haloarcula]KAA9396439.1 CRISPR-associated endonuclease Cas3'' [Haloarcula sp. CBA1130]KAA9397496.1 CRISPR-associated endonuclease Cas3'' [Haloarcula sp. CBA1129]
MPVRYSHPPEDGYEGVHLREHLDDVARRVNEIVPDRATTPGGESLQGVVETLAYVHDFGKATTFFQEYLRHDTEPEYKPCRYHAPIGSFAAYYALDAQGFETETCLAGFVAVAKHHGRLPDVTQYIYDRAYNSENSTSGAQTNAEQQQAAIAMQLNDIEEHAPELAADLFEEATDSDGSWDGFRHSYKELLDEIVAAVATESGTTINRESLSESCYGLILEIWGSLVLADKTSAASRSVDVGSGSTYEAEAPSMQVLDEYVNDLEAASPADPDGSRTERLNHYRSRARSAVIENAEKFAEEGGGVATLTLPTGMGKTLSGLSAAQTIRDELGGERVVYALPFTSIIDQVVDEIEEIYETDTLGRLLTAHHHLSDIKIVDEDDVDADKADKNDDVAGMLAESWRAGLTVTTFVQLFESLAGPANKQSMKLPALRDSVVILDEPQSLPLDWWKLVPRLVTILTEQYNATVIAMTATQPQLFDEASERVEDVTELVDDPDVYFEATERVQYELDASAERYIETQSEPKAYADAGDELLRAVDAGASTLAVCNTIDSARALFDELTGSRRSLLSVGDIYDDALDAVDTTADIDPEALATRIKNRSDASLLHLSTRLRPLDRLKLIETAKELTDDEHGLITVSTQLIEAGVDISFDRVYRDLAPIDSIVQAAGRCNRSFEREQGRVVIWWLDVPDEQEKTPAEAVYNRGATLLPVAAETLDSVREADTPLSETAVARTAVTEYYRRLHTDKNVGKQEYVEYVDDLRGDELSELSLIDQRNAVDIIICRTDTERKKVEKVRKAWKQYKFDRVRRLMDELKELRVSIPIYHGESEKKGKLGQLNQVHSDTDVLCLDVREHGLSQYFDQNTGFVIPDSTAERRII